MTWNRKNLQGVETVAPAASVYLTPERLEVQRVAREFAMTEVLPVADELDPQREEIPDELLARLAELGYFGVMIDSEHGGLGLGVFEYCLVCRGAGARMDERRQHHRPRQRHRLDRRPAARRAARPQRRGASGSAASRSPSRLRARTSPTSSARAERTATGG